MTTKIKPLYDRVLVKRFDSLEKTEGGIIIPDSAQEKTMLATVVATGDGKKDSETPLKVKDGDTVLMARYSGTEVKIDNADFVMLREDEILGVVEK